MYLAITYHGGVEWIIFFVRGVLITDKKGRMVGRDIVLEQCCWKVVDGSGSRELLSRFK